VQLSRAAVAAPAGAAGKRPDAAAEASIDTRAHSDLRQQIDDEPRRSDSPDLLDPAAPKE
jgi:hypothetical protein